MALQFADIRLEVSDDVLLLQLRSSLNTQVAFGGHHKLLHDAVPLGDFFP